MPGVYMSVTVTLKSDGFKQYLSGLQKDIPAITARAINSTLADIWKAERAEILDSFDNPTPYIQKSPRYQKAEPTKGKLYGRVYINDDVNKGTPAYKILRPHVFSGPRKHKKHEIALIKAGIMPSDHYAIPGEAAKLDRYGNISRGQIVQMLSWFRAFPETGYRANRPPGKKYIRKGNKNKYGLAYFAGRPGGGNSHNYPLGIWVREYHGLGTRPRPVIIFVPKTPQYEKRFDFFFTAKHTTERKLQKHFTYWLFKKYLGRK